MAVGHLFADLKTEIPLINILFAVITVIARMRKGGSFFVRQVYNLRLFIASFIQSFHSRCNLVVIDVVWHHMMKISGYGSLIS